MNKLQENRKKFEHKEIDKAKYIDTMYTYHTYLFMYAAYLKHTDIASIRISDEHVTMTMKNSNITLLCNNHDKRLVPLEILNFGSYEKKENELLLHILPDRCVVLDIGANIGWYSFFIARYRPLSHIYAFEPIQSTFELLKKNVLLNKVPNIRIQNSGLSNESKKIPFYINEDESVNASLRNLKPSKRIRKVYCTVQTMDSFVRRRHLTIDFIKCDVEGAELFVFQGGKQCIQNQKPIIFSEILRKWTKHFDYNPNQILALLSSFGYQCFVVRKNRLKKFSKMTEDTIDTNFIFLHHRRHSDSIRQYVR